MKLREDRGNILVTALFVAVFLFFLSTALLLSNRQDIALSLSMEHKLKADSAARSAAAETYGQLRQLGEFRGLSGKGGASGVETRVQLVEMPATGRRGKVVRVHCRATSGPVSSYVTYHLLKNSFLASESGDGKVMLLPQGKDKATAIFANGVLTELGEVLPNGMVAYGGPAFLATAATTQSQVAFRDKIPVFPESGEGPLKVIDPALTLAPNSGDETVLSRLDYKGNTFSWTSVPPPTELGTPIPDISDRPVVFKIDASGAWNSVAVAGRGNQLSSYSWYDSQPDTAAIEEAQGLTRGPVIPAIGAREGGSGMPTSSWYITRGAIAPSGQGVYTHGWQYLYRPYRGGVPDNVTGISGSRLTRWPCLLHYSGEGVWTKVWGPLDDSGNVESSIVPDPAHLWATSKGKLYGLTGGSARQIVTFEKGKVTVKDGTISAGSLTLYRDRLYLLGPESSKLVDIEDASMIGLENLPTGMPGVEGEMFDFSSGPSKSIAIDAAGVLDTSSEGALDIPPRKLLTVFPNYLLSYSMVGVPVSDNENLFVALRVSPEGIDASSEIWDTKLVEDYLPRGGTTLASYGDESWQIQPAGLRYFLLRELFDPTPPPESGVVRLPGEDVGLPVGFAQSVVATYAGLPKSAARYSIVSIDTRPFEFQEDGQ